MVQLSLHYSSDILFPILSSCVVNWLSSVLIKIEDYSFSPFLLLLILNHISRLYRGEDKQFNLFRMKTNVATLVHF